MRASSRSERRGAEGREREPSRAVVDRAVEQPIATKPKGLKKILSKMRRANSGHIPQEERKAEEGIVDKEQYRASAGSKLALGWELQKAAVPFESDVPFDEWDTDTICAWLDTLGLYMYTNEVKKTVTSGAQLAGLTSQELETKLGVKNLMHRKKVCLALLARQQNTEDPAGLLDHQVPHLTSS